MPKQLLYRYIFRFYRQCKLNICDLYLEQTNKQTRRTHYYSTLNRTHRMAILISITVLIVSNKAILYALLQQIAEPLCYCWNVKCTIQCPKSIHGLPWNDTISLVSVYCTQNTAARLLTLQCKMEKNSSQAFQTSRCTIYERTQQRRFECLMFPFQITNQTNVIAWHLFRWQRVWQEGNGW